APPSQRAVCLTQRADIEFLGGRFDSAAEISRRAASVLEQAGLTSGIDYITVLNSEANALENLKRRREALTIYQRLAATMDSTGRGQTSSRNVIRHNIGLALANLGEATAAQP